MGIQYFKKQIGTTNVYELQRIESVDDTLDSKLKTFLLSIGYKDSDKNTFSNAKVVIEKRFTRL